MRPRIIQFLTALLLTACMVAASSRSEPRRPNPVEDAWMKYREAGDALAWGGIETREAALRRLEELRAGVIIMVGLQHQDMSFRRDCLDALMRLRAVECLPQMCKLLELNNFDSTLNGTTDEIASQQSFKSKLIKTIEVLSGTDLTIQDIEDRKAVAQAIEAVRKSLSE